MHVQGEGLCRIRVKGIAGGQGEGVLATTAAGRNARQGGAAVGAGTERKPLRLVCADREGRMRHREGLDGERLRSALRCEHGAGGTGEYRWRADGEEHFSGSRASGRVAEHGTVEVAVLLLKGGEGELLRGLTRDHGDGVAANGQVLPPDAGRGVPDGSFRGEGGRRHGV